jgi:16S rRNA (adenine(1408)-N(1))-methyltransferase
MIPSARRCEREGLTNALFVCASAEHPPEPLLGKADEVFVQLPWGRLLSGVVLGDPDVCRGLRALAKTGASLRVTVGAGIWRAPVPKEIRGLPELTAEYVDATLTGRLAEHGWKVTDFGAIADPATSWGRRLGADLVELRAEAV